MPREAPLENAQNGLQQPQQVIFCSFSFPVIFLVSAELRTAGFSFFVKLQFIDFCHLTIFFINSMGKKKTIGFLFVSVSCHFSRQR
jgi:hypothetical protein